VLSCAQTDRQTDIHTDYNQSRSTSLSRISNGDRSCSYIPGQLVLFTHGMLSNSRPWQGLPPCRGTRSRCAAVLWNWVSAGAWPCL